MAGEAHKQILVVDDDAAVRQLLKGYLEDHGFVVHGAENGAAMAQTTARTAVDLIVLDLVLPGENGLDLAREIRKTSNLPIIMLTGKGDEIDRVIGLEMGADDYLAKPFSPRELLARIRSVLRRTEGAGEAKPAAGERVGVARFADWKLDLGSRRLFSPGGEEVELTPGEFDLLAAFVSHRNRVLSREQLLDYARDDGAAVFDRSVDVQVMRLRRKIEANPKKPELIKTARTAGYMFAPPVEWE